MPRRVGSAARLRRPDLVQRDFNAAGPNELWVADRDEVLGVYAIHFPDRGC
jgi:hypothetical protein